MNTNSTAPNSSRTPGEFVGSLIELPGHDPRCDKARTSESVMHETTQGRFESPPTERLPAEKLARMPCANTPTTKTHGSAVHTPSATAA